MCRHTRCSHQYRHPANKKNPINTLTYHISTKIPLYLHSQNHRPESWNLWWRDESTRLCILAERRPFDARQCTIVGNCRWSLARRRRTVRISFDRFPIEKTHENYYYCLGALLQCWKITFNSIEFILTVVPTEISKKTTGLFGCRSCACIWFHVGILLYFLFVFFCLFNYKYWLCVFDWNEQQTILFIVVPLTTVYRSDMTAAFSYVTRQMNECVT